MKTRESGMPDNATWNSFFDPETTLTALGLTEKIGDTVDFGCGYGTFTLAAARRIRGILYGFDIESAMITECRQRAEQEGLHNVRFQKRIELLNFRRRELN